MGYLYSYSSTTPNITPIRNVYSYGAPVLNNDTTAVPDGFCGTPYEYLQVNKKYSTVTFVDDYSYDHCNDKEEHHPIKISDCPKCNSNLPLRQTDDKGICKCEFCGKEVYVW